jgi:hypothetical protein
MAVFTSFLVVAAMASHVVTNCCMTVRLDAEATKMTFAGFCNDDKTRNIFELP